MLAELQDVSKTYRHEGRTINAMSNVSLTLQPQQFVAVCGPSGCGKSTMLLTLGGLLKPDSGKVIVDDTNVYALSPNERARFRAEKIGFVFQQFHLVPYLSIIDNVLAAQLGIAKSSDTRQRAEALLEGFGLVDRRGHRPSQLSTGERQRTAMARALLNSPQYLLADEPTGNLDQDNATRVLDELAKFASSGGTVLLVTHDQQAAERANSRVLLQEGRLCESVPTSSH
jgi:ABC-type lipoprotein export system ATPase subunit